MPETPEREGLLEYFATMLQKTNISAQSYKELMSELAILYYHEEMLNDYARQLFAIQATAPRGQVKKG